MEYSMFVSKNEIFEYIINELNEDIRSAKSSSGYQI